MWQNLIVIHDNWTGWVLLIHTISISDFQGIFCDIYLHFLASNYCNLDRESTKPKVHIISSSKLNFAISICFRIKADLLVIEGTTWALRHPFSWACTQSNAGCDNIMLCTPENYFRSEADCSRAHRQSFPGFRHYQGPFLTSAAAIL